MSSAHFTNIIYPHSPSVCWVYASLLTIITLKFAILSFSSTTKITDRSRVDHTSITTKWQGSGSSI
jgi:hypothetical protein